MNDGTIIPDGEAGLSTAGSLWCYLSGYTLQQAASLFFDSSKTQRIIFQYGNMEDTYEGYTNCVQLGTGAGGEVSVCMTKGG